MDIRRILQSTLAPLKGDREIVSASMQEKRLGRKTFALVHSVLGYSALSGEDGGRSTNPERSLQSISRLTILPAKRLEALLANFLRHVPKHIQAGIYLTTRFSLFRNHWLCRSAIGCC